MQYNKAGDTMRKKLALTIYVIVFYAIWTVRTILFSDLFSDINPITAQILKEIIKMLIWFVPAWILIGKYNNSMFVKRENIFGLKIPWLKILPVIAAFSVLILVNSYRTNGKLAINESFGVHSIIIVLFVGVTEETVFRGWLLNSTYTEKNQYLSIGINAVMFLLIHFPIWSVKGVLLANIVSGGFIQIILLSVIFSYSFIKTKNLLVPIILHMYWDLLAFML